MKGQKKGSKEKEVKANDNMLISHLNAFEQILIAQSSDAQNAGHPNIRGGPREWFIRDFLENHLPSTL